MILGGLQMMTEDGKKRLGCLQMTTGDCQMVLEGLQMTDGRQNKLGGL